MRKTNFNLYLFLFFSATTISVFAQNELTVGVRNVRSSQGKVMAATEKGQYTMVNAVRDSVQLVLRNVPSGQCKLYIYHDESGNYRLDEADGIPIENCAILDLEMSPAVKKVDVCLKDLHNVTEQ